tara:strand:- start:234 stop:914 length:681 start_codon:yes stop_codon:yes gene_type:complete
MKNTIKNTVKEVYNTNVKNMNINPSLSASQFTSNNVVKSLKSSNVSNNFSNNNVQANLDLPKNQSNMYILLFFMMLIVFAFSIVAYLFRDKIKGFFREIKSESKEVVEIKAKDKELKETKTRLEDKNNITEKDKLLIKKDGKAIVDDKITKNTKKKDESESKSRTMKKSENKIYYSDDKIVKENNMYCYIGKDDDMRQCVQAFKEDVCTSGDIFGRIDECLVPQKG